MMPLYFPGILTTILLVATLSQALAQANYEWVETEGSEFGDGGMDVVADLDANSFVTGYFAGTVQFGNTLLTSQGDQDIFIAKYDSDGNVIWANSAGSPEGADVGESIALDDAGNVYITGRFNGVAIFGNVEITSHLDTYDGINYYNDDIFVAKYSPAGTFLWVREAGGNYNDSGMGIDVDALGNTYITGFYDTEADFGTTTLSTSGGQHAFVAKYNTSGMLQWAETSTGDTYEQGNDIATDDLGNSYITGHFVGHAFFDGNQFTSTGETFPGDPTVYYWNEDIFTAKFSPTGTNLWVESAGGTGYDQGLGIDIDNAGNSYITGFYAGAAVFGGNEVVVSNYDPVYELFTDDIFIAKYNTVGNHEWVETAGGLGSEAGRDIETDNTGNSVITGYFNGEASFGGTDITSTLDADSNNSNDIFAARYDSSGDFEWVTEAGGPGDDRGNGIGMDSPSSFFITGYHSPPSATFGAAGTVTSNGADDIFLARLNDPAITLPVNLISFKAEKQDRSALLTWATAQEENNAGFDIEVSNSSSGFTKIGSVAPKNGLSSTGYRYTFTDRNIQNPGTRYYRLVQYDHDGARTYLGIRAVTFTFESSTRLAAGPNPFTHSFQVLIESETNQDALLTVTDVTGRSISAQQIKLKKGGNSFTIHNLNNAGKGVYFLTFSSQDKIITLRMVKQ
ncbi:MAG: T9SS type A sorting domain-containing protein [Sphingobacteriales bacterium]|nr:MAG: T9SS type A sorting domain-containing protein [Sphingobacteriales bacterium]